MNNKKFVIGLAQDDEIIPSFTELFNPITPTKEDILWCEEVIKRKRLN